MPVPDPRCPAGIRHSFCLLLHLLLAEKSPCRGLQAQAALIAQVCREPSTDARLTNGDRSWKGSRRCSGGDSRIAGNQHEQAGRVPGIRQQVTQGDTLTSHIATENDKDKTGQDRMVTVRTTEATGVAGVGTMEEVE